MVKWFDDKFEKRRIRKNAKYRLNPGFFERVFRKFSLTNWLIIINIIVYLILYPLFIFGSEGFVELVALQPNGFFSGSFWQVFTSIFVHIHVWHLFANMISLFFIGNFVEKLIGRKRLFWLYLLSGIFAGLFYASLAYFFGISTLDPSSLRFGSLEWLRFGLFGSPLIFAVGASGAIFSLLGLLAVLTPSTRVYMIAGPLIALIIESVFATIFPSSPFMGVIRFFLYFYIIFSIFSIFSFNSSIMKFALPLEMPFWLLPIIAIVPLVVIGLFVLLPIGNTAHLGGLLVGLAYGFYLKKKYKRKTAMIRKYFSR